eukprot:3745008-Amphidinium_carterae.1
MLAYPHHILQGRVPPKLLRILQQWITSPWFQVKGAKGIGELDDDATVLKSKRGVRQGDCLSSYLFCVFFDSILDVLHRHLTENTMALDFQRQVADDESHFVAELRSGPEASLVTMVAFADDLMVPLAHPDPRCLLKQPSTFLTILHRTFEQFQLRMNL